MIIFMGLRTNGGSARNPEVRRQRSEVSRGLSPNPSPPKPLTPARLGSNFLSVKLVVASTARRAFTLIELVVVVAIIALLMAILMPALKKARESTRRTVCATQLRGGVQALHSYANDNDGSFIPSRLSSDLYGTNLWTADTGEPAVSNNWPQFTVDYCRDYGGDYDLFDCPNLPGFFERQVAFYLDNGIGPWGYVVFGGYGYLGAAKFQNQLAWGTNFPFDVYGVGLNREAVPNETTDPFDWPILGDLVYQSIAVDGDPDPVNDPNYYAIIPHPETGNAHHAYNVPITGLSPPLPVWGIQAVPAGGNYAHVDSSVRWYDWSEHDAATGALSNWINWWPAAR